MTDIFNFCRSKALRLQWCPIWKTIEFYDKRDEFNFFFYLCSDIHSSPEYGLFVSRYTTHKRSLGGILVYHLVRRSICLSVQKLWPVLIFPRTFVRVYHDLDPKCMSFGQSHWQKECKIRVRFITYLWRNIGRFYSTHILLIT